MLCDSFLPSSYVVGYDGHCRSAATSAEAPARFGGPPRTADPPAPDSPDAHLQLRLVHEDGGDADQVPDLQAPGQAAELLARAGAAPAGASQLQIVVLIGDRAMDKSDLNIQAEIPQSPTHFK